MSNDERVSLLYDNLMAQFETLRQACVYLPDDAHGHDIWRKVQDLGKLLRAYTRQRPPSP